MNIIEIISKKKENKKLSKEEIEYFIKEYTKGDITDYQAAALVMAIYLNGMDDEEITNLTLSMANSGKIIDLSGLKKIVVDKHSTGGVGDKVSLILLPIISSLGVDVAKMSGRGLGFTGGTIDKLESIPGYNTNISMEEFQKNVNEIGISIIAQTLDVAPADKKLYALRDTISCVESIPLIASSIMSKKIASGADKLVLDVTVGSGAFMKDIETATELAKKMVIIGKNAGIDTVAILTNMDEPLGYAIGNSLEIIEVTDFLRGEMPKDLEKVVLELGAYMIKLAGISDDLEKNKEMMYEKIENGEAFKKLIELVENQGGDISYIYDSEKLLEAKYIEEIKLNKDGYICKMDASKIGKIACDLGAGRITKEDKINNNVGIVLKYKVGEKIDKDTILGYIHADDLEKLNKAKEDINKAIHISSDMNDIIKKEHILGIIE